MKYSRLFAVKISLITDMGFIKSFYDNYLSLSLYEALGIDLPINLLVLGAAIALCIGCFYIGHKQSTEALILRKLTRSEAYGESCAKTLSEIGLGANRFAARILSLRSGSIRTVVFRKGEVRQSYEDYIAAERAKKKLPRAERMALEAKCGEGKSDDGSYYIPEDMKDKAKRLYERNTSSPIKTVIYCILILAFAFAIILLMPTILELITLNKPE